MISLLTLTSCRSYPRTFNPWEYNTLTDKWTIPLADNLTADQGNVTLTINYRGHMRDDMAGFYRSYYYENGARVWMAATQFEPDDARRAFPCFDEPRFKTPFTISVIRPADMVSMSNGILVGSAQEPTSDKWRDDFEVTPLLPTYLVAFIVSRYEIRNNVTNEFGVYARPEAINATNRALEFGKLSLAKFDDYFEMEYYSLGNKKIDMTAIPDFSIGAMENWGLLTYRETLFLYYPGITTDLQEQRIVAIIAHEIVHQWIGNLVGIEWWSYTWLKEGFAHYYQYFGVEMVETGWELEEQFVVESYHNSMMFDSTDNTHPMTDTSVVTKQQARGIFTLVSYNKAGSVIRMLEHYIGSEKYQLTLKTFLADNKHKVTPDRWMAAIEKVNPNADVAGWFSPWTTTAGFPLVTVRLDDQTLRLTQHRFMQTEAGSKRPERYNIPITYTIDFEDYNDVTPKFVFWMNETGEKSYVLPRRPEKYYILNPKQTGFYRVNYDENNWNKIREALETDNFDGIHVINRAQIVNDLFQLARAGIVPYSTAIDIIRYLRRETHYITWLTAINFGLTFLSQRVPNNTADQELFGRFVTDTMRVAYEHLTFDTRTNDSKTENYNRVIIQTWVCRYGNEDCVQKSQEYFASFMVGTPVPKNQRTAVYCNAVRYGNTTHFNFLHDNIMNQDIATEQLNFLVGMGCTRDQTLVNRYLDLLINTDDIRRQDRISTMNNVLNSNPEGPDMMYNYVTANHAAWFEKIGNYGILNTIAGRFTRAEQFEKYMNWLETTRTALGASHASLVSAANAAMGNLDWDEIYMREFMDHLREISSATTKAVSIFVSLISFSILYFMN